MKVMKLEAIYSWPNFSKKNFVNRIYPYLLKGLPISIFLSYLMERSSLDFLEGLSTMCTLWHNRSLRTN